MTNQPARYSIAAISLMAAAITGCSSVTVVRDFCTVVTKSPPITISKSDSPATKRDAVALNLKHKELCTKGK